MWYHFVCGWVGDAPPIDKQGMADVNVAVPIIVLSSGSLAAGFIKADHKREPYGMVRKMSSRRAVGADSKKTE